MEERQEEQSRKLDNLDNLLWQFISSQMKDKNTQNPIQPSEMSTESAETGNTKKRKGPEETSHMKVTGKSRTIGTADKGGRQRSLEAPDDKVVNDEDRSNEGVGKSSSCDVLSIQVCEVHFRLT
jgi:hypothetical protein